MKIIIKITLSILFIACLWDWPYSYYQMVRFIGMIGFLWLFVLDNKTSINKYIWIASAILINPIFKIYLGRELWNFVDLVWVLIFISTEIIEYKTKKNKHEKN